MHGHMNITDLIVYTNNEYDKIKIMYFSAQLHSIDMAKAWKVVHVAAYNSISLILLVESHIRRDQSLRNA